MITKRLFLPGVLLAILALLALNLTNSPSGAAPPASTIDLVGTYEGTWEMSFWEPGCDEVYFSDPEYVTLEIVAQQDHLFRGTWGDQKTPIAGAIMSPEGSATAFCIRGLDGQGYGSVAVIPGRGKTADQVVMEVLLTAGTPDAQWNWSGYGTLTKAH